MNIKKEKLVSLGLSDELADKVVDELKTAEKAELKGNGTSITQYEEQIAQLKQQISDNQAEYEANIAKIKLDNAIDNAITKSGARNNKAVRSLLDENKLELGEDGSVKGLEEAIEALVKSDGYLFTPKDTKTTLKGATPHTSNTDTVKEAKIDPKKMTYTQLCEYLATNPDAKL